MLKEAGSYLQSALSTKYLSSAISPMLWMNAMISMPCIFIAAFIASPPMSYAFFLLAVGIIVYSLSKYEYLVKIDPRLVQSERHQVEMAKLDIVAMKGREIIIDPVNLDLSSEPNYLPHMSNDEEVEQ
jgi:hypothetical protein